MKRRPLLTTLEGLPASDGAGVELRRLIGQPALMQLDPFLLMDAFGSDDPGDYLPGFPPHPHRGFETVTYLLDGRMRHRDSAGHEGVIEAGGVQWMSAGSGIVHSEMPEQDNGLLRGFQLWINLPRSHKMTPPAYQEFDAAHIPVEQREGARIRVIAGQTRNGLRGPVEQPLTAPLYLDVTLQPGQAFEEAVPTGHQAFLLLVDGALELEDTQGESGRATAGQLALLGDGDGVEARATDEGARFLLIAGRPLGEPVARGGPFVMNSEEEIRQAFEDYRAGRMGAL